MPIPDPNVGLVIQYGYLWKEQAQKRQEEGKDRPCLIVDVQGAGKDKIVTVQPITTKGETIKPGDGVEIPQQTKSRLGLDADRRSWVITNESNKFEWPGHDLTQTPNKASGEWAYGYMPEAITLKVRDQARQHEHQLSVVDRDTSPPKIETPFRRSSPELEPTPAPKSVADYRRGDDQAHNRQKQEDEKRPSEQAVDRFRRSPGRDDGRDR